ncbi:MAG TPA: serine hydrolase domain-containing protein [Myxococcaceae bacterium]|nr:serine hydrolase domain-containing protein [Myxococcaceae bacterium]
MRIGPTIAAVASTLTACHHTPAQVNFGGPWSGLDRVLEAGVANKQVAGVVVLVARDGKVVYRRAAGVADREEGRPVTENSLFRMGSMTKAVVSVAALSLVDQGVLGLEDPVARWLPQFRPRLPDGTAPAITVRDLLTHTAGLDYLFLEPPDGPYHRAQVSTGFDQPGLSLEENLGRLGSVPLLFPPGTRWQYSMATDVLGAVIESAAGAPLPEVVQERVTSRLLMEATFSPSPAQLERLATPYAAADPSGVVRMGEPHQAAMGPLTLTFSPLRASVKASYPSGGAGMIGTAGSYLTFLEALRTGRPKLLETETLAALTSNQIGALAVPKEGGDWGWSLAFPILKQPEPKTPWASGTWSWGGVWGTHFIVDPAAGLSVVVMTNTAIIGLAGPFPDAVRDAVYAAITP